MPCRCEGMDPTRMELELSRVACLLDELDGKPINKSYWRGFHPVVYNRTGAVDADAMVSELCGRLQGLDVGKLSLEMQIWWRDHKEADRARLERELSAERDAVARQAALQKLTEHERRLLGL